ncbi:hypothetical protein B566_EDAN004217 [Ephemera danica]|nr:hypothetical protein B566_EDAN004217 [Ephemera danica]
MLSAAQLLTIIVAVFGIQHAHCVQIITAPPTSSEDPTLDPTQMIARAGYPAESHLVTTEDGYILTVHRIPTTRARGEPILLQHGLLASSADWLIPGPGRALAYILSDLGYDIWLGNARGNTYSRAHRNLSASDSAFWNFTWHEMGYYDLPAVTQMIVDKTGHKQLVYVGHSMGTTMFWTFCATRPELQHRVRQMHALAPVAFMSRMQSPLRNLAPYVTLALLGEHEFLPHGEVQSLLVEEFLRVNHLAEKGTEFVFFSICGFDPAEFNKTLLPIILGHTPAGASTQSVLQYLQEVQSGKFRQYDEGNEAGNMRRYGVPEPPEYDLSLIQVPVALHYSLNDYLANPEVSLSTFNHLDFLWANDAPRLVYQRVVKLIQTQELQSTESHGLLRFPTRLLHSWFKSRLNKTAEWVRNRNFLA